MRAHSTHTVARNHPWRAPQEVDGSSALRGNVDISSSHRAFSSSRRLATKSRNSFRLLASACPSVIATPVKELVASRINSSQAERVPFGASVTNARWKAGFQSTKPHFQSAIRCPGSEASNSHLYAMLRNSCNCDPTASALISAARVNPSAAPMRSAITDCSRTRLASFFCSASCCAASSFCWAIPSAARACWCAFDRFSTVTATHAATTAEITAAGIAPKAPAQIDIQASRSIPQSMGLSLREAC